MVIGALRLMSALWVRKGASLDGDFDILWFPPGLIAGTQGLRALKGPRQFITERVGFQ